MIKDVVLVARVVVYVDDDVGVVVADVLLSR